MQKVSNKACVGIFFWKSIEIKMSDVFGPTYFFSMNFKNRQQKQKWDIYFCDQSKQRYIFYSESWHTVFDDSVMWDWLDSARKKTISFTSHPTTFLTFFTIFHHFSPWRYCFLRSLISTERLQYYCKCRCIKRKTRK